MPAPAESFRQRGLSAWTALERAFDAAFGSGLNPLRHLGAIGVAALAVVTASGVGLYAVFDTSLAGAHASIVALRDWPLHTGVLLRGLHRYASDLLVVAMLLHLLREWLVGHDRGVHRATWWTGVALIAFVFGAAIVGFWLHWDELGHHSALATAEWVDALPWLPLATPFARNFLAGAVDDRLFSLFVFVHVGVPLLLLLVLWWHLQRLARPAVWPPRALAIGLLAVLAALALLLPVTSHAPAALDRVPLQLRLDWLLLAVHPLVDATSPGFAAALVLGGLAALALLPLRTAARRTPREPVAVVDPANCNGCRRCLDDCPYAAISMRPHPNQRIGRSLAVVDADLCIGCGICAGSCPSSTPFRSTATLVTGIDMPQRPLDALRRALRDALAGCAAERPLLVFGCDLGARPDAGDAADVRRLGLLCAGQLPPSFVEYALRDGAAGVLVLACREGGCAFRLGDRWTRERLDARREPHLRASVDRERVDLLHADPGDEAAVAAAIERLRRRVQTLVPPRTATVEPRHA